MTDNKDNKDTKDNQELENNNLVWSKNIDSLLAKWCDEAKCYEWMHSEAYDKFYHLSRKFLLMVNILSALSGISNVVAGNISYNGFQISWLFGSITIIISTINFLQDKLGYQQKAETHQRLSNNWCIIKNKIEEIIYLPYNSRKDCKTFLKMIKTDINQNILDGNSLIPDEIKEKCHEKFNNIPNFDIPDICGKVEHTKIYMGEEYNKLYNEK